LLELLTTKQHNNYLPEQWERETHLMAIVNITEDSFSDGGLYIDLPSAINHATLCINQGAHILDIGAQSTRPGASELGAEIEIKRLVPLIKELKLLHPEIPISVDTFHHSVADKAINVGADWVNDVSGGRRDPEMYSVIADKDCPYILTHSRGNSMTMDSLATYSNVVKDVKNELLNQIDLAVSKGIKNQQIIIDPGLGFAKNVDQNLTLLKHIDEFVSMNYAVLIGASRKRFIGSIINEPDPNKRIFGTSAVASRCVIAGVDILRVHDIKEIYQVITMTKSII